MIAEVKRQYQKGAVIALMWHAVRPTEDEPVGFRDSVQGHLTDFEFRELLTPGTDLYQRWSAQVEIQRGDLSPRSCARAPCAAVYRVGGQGAGSRFSRGARTAKGSVGS
jgi:hypothetical protein